MRGVDHEMFRDLLAVVSMHISEPQSRTFPLYMTFWQLHSILYLEKSRDIWDSAQDKFKQLVKFLIIYT